MHAENLKIAPATDNDLHEISMLAEEEFAYARQSEQKILERKKNGAFIFKAIENNQLLGFVDFEVHGQNAFITALSVKKEFRGQHIGKRLAEFAVNFLSLSGAKKITLLVRQDNMAAKKLYENLGFHSAGLHEKKIEGHTIERMEMEIREQGGA